jgi:hypothetical protein
MTVAILDVRPTLESGVEPCVSGARDFVSRAYSSLARPSAESFFVIGVAIATAASLPSGGPRPRAPLRLSACHRLPREAISLVVNEPCCFVNKGAPETAGTLAGY